MANQFPTGSMGCKHSDMSACKFYRCGIKIEMKAKLRWFTANRAHFAKSKLHPTFVSYLLFVC